MKRLHLAISFAISSAALGAIACGSISDPTRDGNEPVATVSGALTGTTVPANTRVALVWKAGANGPLAVGSDVAVVNGKFTMNLSEPPASYFAEVDDSSSMTGLGDAPNTKPPTPTTAAGTRSFGTLLRPRDAVSGQITGPLHAAVAGFVVYEDTNRNGKLDISGTDAVTTDKVLGGNKELILAYLRGGGTLDYEKLRDRAGILPHAGYNLVWDEGRWLPLDAVDLKIGDDTRLPNAVCAADGVDSAPNTSSPIVGPSDAGPSNVYPSPNDPGLQCAPDGRSFTYTSSNTCPPPPAPKPPGLCSPGYAESAPCAGGTGSAIPDGATPPPGWPCTVAPAADAGPAPDAGPPPDPAADAGPAPDAGQ